MLLLIENLLIGIIGGIVSGVIVSRIFLIRECLDKQLDFLKEMTYYFGTLMAFFDSVEIILKMISDESDEIEMEIERDPEYLKKHKIIDADKLISDLKMELLVKAVDKICSRENPLLLKEKEFLALQDETIKTIKKYKNIKDFRFSTIDDCKKEIEDLEKKYEDCLRKSNRIFARTVIKDKILICLLLLVISLMVVFVLLSYV